uniref:Uncharacterized protein n=1 Tax=Cacopsylla melanoneura TaxID=428564 RepID=A0A8D8Q253_9HEMI
MEASGRCMKELKRMCGELELEVKTHEMELKEVIDEYKTADDDVKKVMEEIENMKKKGNEPKKKVEHDHNDATVEPDEDYEQSLMNQIEKMRIENAKILQEIIQLNTTLGI